MNKHKSITRVKNKIPHIHPPSTQPLWAMRVTRNSCSSPLFLLFLAVPYIGSSVNSEIFAYIFKSVQLTTISRPQFQKSDLSEKFVVGQQDR